jgi:hypothetical protein
VNMYVGCSVPVILQSPKNKIENVCLLASPSALLSALRSLLSVFCPLFRIPLLSPL